MLARHPALTWALRLAGALGAGVLLIAAAIVLRTHQHMEARFATPRGPVALPQGLERAEPVRLRAADGVALAGWYLAPHNGAVVVLVHGLEQGRLGLLPEAQALLAHGYGVLLFDLRGHGESGGETTMGDRERLDVRAALDFVRTRPGVRQVGALGFSMGAAALVDVAASQPQPLPVVLQAPFSDREAGLRSDFRHYGWLSGTAALYSLTSRGIDVAGLQPLRDVGRLAGRPLLLMHGTAEQDLAMMERVAAAVRPPGTVWRVEGAGHGAYRQAAGAQYARRLVCFFDEALRDARPCAAAPGAAVATELP